MTALDNAKLKRILTMAGWEDAGTWAPLADFQAIWKAAQAEQREEDARICDGFTKAEYETGKVDHNEQAWTAYCAAAIRGQDNQGEK